jgi:glycosyltransferase involved in cell wall biosynthesis|tara:strand:- start:379 stop:1512 length:1134 start_codon:yes stop_codon:yes gene_type:complete
MHIVFLTNEYPKKNVSHGGIGSFVQFLSEKLVTKGHLVSVVGVDNEHKDINEEINGVRIYRIKKSTAKFAKFVFNSKRINDTLIEINIVDSIDIVEGSELSFAFLPKKASYKKVIRMHGGHHFFAIELNKKPLFWRGFQEKQSFKKADAFIAVSNYVGNQTKKYLNIDFKFDTIYNSVDENKFLIKENLPIQKYSLLFVGTICEKKGIRQLVQAIPFIKEKFPNVELKIIGREWKFTNGKSYTEYLKTFIHNEDIDNINIVGVVPHDSIPQYIQQSEICVYPSHMEAMPIAWLEGLIMAKPVIASDIGPGNEAIVNGVTGLLINPFLPIDIAEKIIELFSNPERAINLGKKAREDVLQKFNSEKIVQENINFYTSLI